MAAFQIVRGGADLAYRPFVLEGDESGQFIDAEGARFG
jgi:hypothetical protein